MGGPGGEIIAKMLQAAGRIADTVVYKAAPQISKTHREFPHEVQNHLERVRFSEEQCGVELDRIRPAVATGRETTAEHAAPDEITAHVARTGWATDPIMLRAHTTDAGTVIPPRSISEATANVPPPFDPRTFRSRAGLIELFQMNIDNGVRLDRLEPLTPINPHYNCHGYTFSRDGAAGWLGGSWVDTILSDNGFRRISDTGSAVPGDVVIYRNSDSVVTHSGVVADVTSGEVSVDSKHSPLSVVRHRIHEVTEMYGSDVTVYRTDRPDGRFLTPVENSGEPAPAWPPAPSLDGS
ncbi:hypothetical protein [Nocardia sp. NPDC019395]|uniref:hypothetical protein n=1 Tax=Nocardia sp. NPDC019395 TaxID=3154686 RepID=UPI0033CC063F